MHRESWREGYDHALFSSSKRLTTSFSPCCSAQTGIIQCISSNSSCSLDEINGVRADGQTLFWQYYVAADRPVAHQSLKKAMDHNMNSVWLTVDAPVGGKREADLRVQLKENPVSGFARTTSWALG